MSTLHPLIPESENLALWEQQEFLSNALLKRDKEIARLREAMETMLVGLTALNDHHTNDHHEGFLSCLDERVSDAFLAYRKVMTEKK